MVAVFCEDYFYHHGSNVYYLDCYYGRSIFVRTATMIGVFLSGMIINLFS